MMEDKNELVLNQVQQISKHIDMADTNTPIKIQKIDDKRYCFLKSDIKEPVFILDEDKKLHTLVLVDTLKSLTKTLKNTWQENFDLKLEKIIWQNIPVDFNDAWAVAMHEIEKLSNIDQNTNALNIDLNHLVTKIKKQHPNLFLNMDEIFDNN